MTAQSFANVLGWSSPFDLVCKLEREKERMEGASTLSELVEHTMNFAMTAYHMIDWVWAVIQRGSTEPHLRYERERWIGAIGGNPPNDIYDVIQWAQRECPGLELCRQLANASKHLSCRLKKSAEAADFQVAPTEAWKDRQRANPYESILDQEQAANSRLVVVLEGEELDLVAVLHDEVFQFWTDLTYSIYIGDQ